MDVNEYLADQLVRHRLAEMREEARRYALAAALTPPRRPLRVLVGLGLIRLGTAVVGESSRAPGALLTNVS
ncbi:MAG TPA: hypothetical protein VGT40_16195 [Methylomirabilota bacterium]|nr:hypothetical protein [Methylomirabilota bacterium]